MKDRHPKAMSAPGFDPKAVAGKVPEPERRIDVLVIGAGLAGATAAMAAAQGGASVLLVDENPVGPGSMGLDTPLYYGGRQSGAVQTRARMLEQVFASRPLLEQALEAGVEMELGVCCWGAFVGGPGLTSLPEPLAGLADETRSWMVGFKRLILATGARDVVFSFGGWDQRGVMGARALHALVVNYEAFVGRRLTILGSGELALNTAMFARSKGLEVAAMIEVGETTRGPADLAARLVDGGVEILLGHVPVLASGGLDGVECLSVRAVGGEARREIACDTVVQAISLTPAIELLDVLGGGLGMRPFLGGHAPASPDGTATTLVEVFVAGDAAGAPGGAHRPEDEALASGRRAGQAALASLGHGVDVETAAPPRAGFDALAYQEEWMGALMAANDASVILCQCEAVTREALLAVRQPTYLGPPSEGMAGRDLGRLLRDGPPQPDQIKRLTRAGMGPCQGRRCREQISLALASAAQEPASRMPLAGYRAPVRPLPLSVIADWNEARAMSNHWDVWFGIPGQWVPYADVGSDREALYADILGGDTHL